MKSGGRAGLTGCVVAAVLALPATAPGQARPPERGAAPSEAGALEGAERLRRAGRLPEARRALEQVLKERPASARALEALAAVLGELEAPAALEPWAARAVRESDGEPALLRLWVAALLDAGRPDSARAVASRWMRSSPEVPAAHLALSAVEEATGRLREAIEVAREGRRAAGDAPELTRELSRLLLEAGEWEAAADEWTRMLDRGRPGATAVLDGLAAWGGDPGPALAALWEALAAPAPEPSGREGGLTLALELGDPVRARAILVGPEAGPPDPALLRAYVVEARRQGAWSEAAWAAGRLAEADDDPARRREWRATAADLALRGRDTAAARRSFQALAEEARPGSPAHRLAARRVFSLRAAAPGGAREAESAYEEFLRAYPEGGAERAEMAAELALAHGREGRRERAWRILDAADPGQRSGAARAPIERARAFLALWAGRPDEAAARLRAAVAGPDAAPGERTPWISLLAALEAADSAEAAVVGRALGELAGDPDAVTADGFRERLAAVPASPARPALLSMAAGGLEEAGRPGEAAALRRWLVGRHPAAPEAPLAMLDIGRALLERDPVGARSWLERLVVEHPESALSPVARRLLADLDGAEGGMP